MDTERLNSLKGSEPTKSIREASQALKDDVKRDLTLLWHQLPAWQQDNHYIVSGYRPASGSYLVSLRSLGYIHNETINIYTHLLGALLAATMGVWLFSALGERYYLADSDDIIVLICFFIGAVACLGMSATYHLISNHSETVAVFGNKLDYLGIVALIWGSFVPCIYYGFRDNISLVKLYWTMITTIGAGCAVVSINTEFRKPKYRPMRAAMFVGMGLSAVVPVLHGISIYGFEQLERTMGLSYVVLQGGLYVLGAALYAARIPERWRPGQFDIFGSSHQIFHVLVVCAAAAHLIGLLKAFDHRHSAGDNDDYPALLQLPKIKLFGRIMR